MTILKTLLEITVYSAVLFGAIMLARTLLKKHISPALQYMAWFILIIRLVMPVTISSGFSFFVTPAPPVSVQDGTAPYAPPEGMDKPGAQGAFDIKTDREPVAFGGNQNHANQSNAAAMQQTSSAPIQLPLESVLIAVWLLGAAAMLTQTGLSAMRLKKRLKTAHTIPPQWQRIADEQTELLDISGRIRIVMIEGFPSPALSAGIWPLIVLPTELLSQPEEQVRFALLHELTHIKRRDHMLSMLLFILRAVYWFNPFVWLTVIKMRHDMETACDSSLTRMMSAHEKKRYAVTVLSMYATPQERYVLGLALGKTKKSAAQRLRGIYMRSRSSAKARTAAVVLSAVLLLTCFTTACQPTPEAPFVQSKDNDSVQKAIESGPEQVVRYSAPDAWQSALYDEDKKIGINVDAQVIVPADIWGIYQLKTKDTDKEYLDKVLRTLIGNAAVYGEDTYPSKDELENTLIRLKRELTEIKKDAGAETKGLEDWIKQVEEALLNAPDEQTTSREVIDLDILLDESPSAKGSANQSVMLNSPSVSVYEGGYVYIQGLADIGRSEPAHIFASAIKGSMLDLRFQVGCGPNGGFGGKEPYAGEPLKGITISQEEAVHIARQAVFDMGFDYLDIAAVHKMSVYDQTRPKGERDRECYAFTFTRSIDGVPATFAYWSGSMTIDDLEAQETQYTVNWAPAEALIGVDDSGVVLAQINKPYSDVDMLAEGIELMEFTRIMDIFNRQAIIEGCFLDTGLPDLVVGRTVNVDTIRLGYMPTIRKDHPNQIIFIPVWDFFGSETTTYDDQYEWKSSSDLYASLDQNYQRTENLGNQAILTINAIDGTILRRMYDTG